jgi:hypothetical protein
VASSEPAVATPPSPRRAHWKTLGFAAGGVGFSSLIFTGLVGAFKEETLFHFAFVLVILVIASLVFFDRIAELVLGGHDEKSAEKTGDRARLLLWSTAIAVLIVILHRSLDTALRNDAEAIGQLLAGGIISAFVTRAWLRGAHHSPSRAARKGSISGALVGGFFGLLAFLVVFFGGQIPGVNPTPPPNLVGETQQLIYRIVLALILGLTIPVLWASLGLLGGLAIDRRWGSSPSRGVLFALSLLAFPLAFGLFAYSVLVSHTWDPEPLRVIFIAVGWGVGLILHSDVCDLTLDVPAPPVPATALPTAESPTVAAAPVPRTRPQPQPIWEVLLIAGLSITVLLLWHQSVTVRFFESDNNLPPPPGRKYQTQFAQSTTRFMNFEMEIPKRLLPSGEFEIYEIWTGPAGSASGATLAKEGEEHPIDRLGWADPGHWPLGHYSVDLRLDKTRGDYNPRTQTPFGKFTFDIVSVNILPPLTQPDPYTPPAAADVIPVPQNPVQPVEPQLPPSPAPSQPVPFQNPQRRISPVQPKPVPMEVFMENARTALASGRLISPENDNALYWVRRAKQISPQDVAAIQIEAMILTEGVHIVERQQKAQNYDVALRLLASLQSLYPDHAELQRLRLKIYIDQEQHQYQKPPSQ